MTKHKNYMGTFEFSSPFDLVLKQIKHNTDFWGSTMCKRVTMEKYCKAKGLENPHETVEKLIMIGIVSEPKKGYVQLHIPPCPRCSIKKGEPPPPVTYVFMDNTFHCSRCGCMWSGTNLLKFCKTP